MPRFDGTGPNGEGPLTGGGFGYCDYKDDGEIVRRKIGLGLRRGYGLGMRRGNGIGFRRLYRLARSYQSEDAVDVLRNEKKVLEARLKRIDEYLKNR